MAETRQFTTYSVVESQSIAEKIGRKLEPGAVLALTGDLGSGKTAFVQGLARGVGVPRNVYVTSPSFTLVNEYPGRCPLYHIDLYRLEDPAEFEDIGIYELLQDQGIVAVEWADRLPPAALDAHLAVHFEILDNASHRITLTAHGAAPSRLLRDLEA